MFRFMGIDPATQKAGFAVLDQDGKLLDKGQISKAKDMTEGEGYLHHYRTYKDIIEKYNVTHIGCEDQFSSVNKDTFKKLSRMSGCVIMLADEMEIPLSMYYPVSWRKLTHSRGDATKDDTLWWVEQKYGLKLLKKENDISDAIGIAYATYTQVMDGTFKKIK